jgi:hypothetical protein
MTGLQVPDGGVETPCLLPAPQSEIQNPQSEIGLSPRRLKMLFWCVALLAGFLQAWAGRHSMTSDGMAYLDMGDAYWRGDWTMAVNAYWSPLSQGRFRRGPAGRSGIALCRSDEQRLSGQIGAIEELVDHHQNRQRLLVRAVAR